MVAVGASGLGQGNADHLRRYSHWKSSDPDVGIERTCVVVVVVVAEENRETVTVGKKHMIPSDSEPCWSCGRILETQHCCRSVARLD